jgi:hypothetical protein
LGGSRKYEIIKALKIAKKIYYESSQSPCPHAGERPWSRGLLNLTASLPPMVDEWVEAVLQGQLEAAQVGAVSGAGFLWNPQSSNRMATNSNYSCV